jgi:RNA recognition motif-containing protein
VSGVIFSGQSMMLKLFVGGISQDTCERDLQHYFEKFGVLEEILIIYDKVTSTRCSLRRFQRVWVCHLRQQENL